MKTLYKDFGLIDGTGAELMNDASMVVEDGKIIEIGQDIKTACDKEVDLSGKFVTPGLMDTHIHVTAGIEPDLNKIYGYNTVDKTAVAIINLRTFIEQGVTFIRDVGSMDPMMPELHLKKFIKEGHLKGPDIYTSGPIITMTGGHGSKLGGNYIADGVEECKKATRDLIGKGVDLIKTVTTGGVGTEGNDINAYQYNIDELEAIVTEAHKAGRKVAAHSHGAQGIKNGVIAGIDSIEHATLADDEAIDMMVEKGTYIVPTFIIQHLISQNGEALGLPAYMIEKEKQIQSIHAESFKKAYEKGVKIACGTDMMPTVVPFSVHKEIALMVANSGMSNLEGIMCATKNSADLIGVLDEYGTLEAGKYADFVVLNENPLDDITALEKIDSVYKTGNKV